MKKLPTGPLTYLITPGDATAANFAESEFAILETIRSAAEDGISLIQIREKSLPAKLLFQLADEAASITRESDAILLINDRADIALAAGADGVHLPSNSLPVGVVRAKFPMDFIVGVSTHTIAEVQKAQAAGADFAVFSPVFDTPGKGPAKGFEELRSAAAAAAPFPVIALGGIDETNCRAALENGAVGIAAIRALNNPASRRRICAEIYSGLG